MESALKAAEKDVKDTSAGVLKDLKRFQREKEDDLRRMMVRVLGWQSRGCANEGRLFMQSAILNGPRRTWRLGRRRKVKWIRLC